MQDSARQDTLFSSLSFDRLPISFVKRLYPVTILMIVYPAISRPIEGLMSLSFCMGCREILVMMNWDERISRAGNLLADFTVEHACVLTNDGNFR